MAAHNAVWSTSTTLQEGLFLRGVCMLSVSWFSPQQKPYSPKSCKGNLGTTGHLSGDG